MGLEKQAKKRAEEMKMSNLGREDKQKAIIEAMEKQELTYEASELKKLLYEIEKEKRTELKDAEQFWKERIEVLEKQTKEKYEKRIAEALEEERKESKKREMDYEGQKLLRSLKTRSPKHVLFCDIFHI